MAKANITKKKAVSIKGVLDILSEDNQINVVIEDGEAMSLAGILQDFDNCEVTINVAESVDIA
jgi:hypothetical protein